MGSKSYLEIKVPLRTSAVWFGELKRLCGEIPVKWQRGYYHITMAFLNEATKEQQETVGQIISRRLKDAEPMPMTFDKVDAFTIFSGEKHIINLTSTQPNASFVKLTDDIRRDLLAVGFRLDSDFLLHVTLGWVLGTVISLERLRNKLAALSVPSFTLNLNSFEYRVFRGDSIATWKVGRHETKKLTNDLDSDSFSGIISTEITDVIKEKTERFLKHLLNHFEGKCFEYHYHYIESQRICHYNIYLDEYNGETKKLAESVLAGWKAKFYFQDASLCEAEHYVFEMKY